MWRELRWIAILLTFALQTESVAYAANTHSKRVSPATDIRVVSVTADAAGNFVLLSTQRSRQLPFPSMHYMPAPDGHSIMNVDFAGTILQAPQPVITFDRSPVTQVRIGQLQVYPPIMRISMVAHRTEVFNQVDFRSAPGTLTIKLPAAASATQPNEPSVIPRPAPAATTAQVIPTAPAIAPAPAKASRPTELRGPIATSASDAVYLPLPKEEEQQNAPPVAPSRFKRFFKKLFDDDDRQQESPPAQPSPKNSATPPAPKPAPDVVHKPTTPLPSTAKPMAQPVAAAGPLVQISTSTEPLALNIASAGKFTYRTFHLREPDRLVIDLSGLAQPNVQVEQPGENDSIKAIRVGNPEGNPNITRVVLDLADEDIAEVPTFSETPTSTALHLVLQKDATAGKPEELKPIKPGTTVVLDAGHGGSDPGAQRGDIQEKEITLAIVEKLRKALDSKGIKVHLTRSDDTYVSLEDRVKVTNSLSPEAFVSIHINSLETNNQTTGIETYYQNEASKDLAKLIHACLVAGLTAPDRGVRKARFYVINHTPVPAILAEVGFISNKDERDKLISSDYQKQIAAAVADGVILFLSGGTGTISTTAPSETEQSFTQNLQSAKTQQLKFKKKRLATTRSL